MQTSGTAGASDGNEATWSILSGTATLNICDGCSYGDVSGGEMVTVVIMPVRQDQPEGR